MGIVLKNFYIWFCYLGIVFVFVIIYVFWMKKLLIRSRGWIIGVESVIDIDFVGDIVDMM